MAGKNPSMGRTIPVDVEAYDKANLQLGRARAVLTLLYSDVSNGNAVPDHLILESALAQIMENLGNVDLLLDEASERAKARVEPAGA